MHQAEVFEKFQVLKTSFYCWLANVFVLLRHVVIVMETAVSETVKWSNQSKQGPWQCYCDLNHISWSTNFEAKILCNTFYDDYGVKLNHFFVGPRVEQISGRFWSDKRTRNSSNCRFTKVIIFKCYFNLYVFCFRIIFRPMKMKHHRCSQNLSSW